MDLNWSNKICVKSPSLVFSLFCDQFIVDQKIFPVKIVLFGDAVFSECSQETGRRHTTFTLTFDQCCQLSSAKSAPFWVWSSMRVDAVPSRVSKGQSGLPTSLELVSHKKGSQMSIWSHMITDHGGGQSTEVAYSRHREYSKRTSLSNTSSQLGRDDRVIFRWLIRSRYVGKTQRLHRSILWSLATFKQWSNQIEVICEMKLRTVKTEFQFRLKISWFWKEFVVCA